VKIIYIEANTEATSLDLNAPFSWNHFFAPAAGRKQMGVDWE
jgi:hypothetical protein